MTKLSKKDLLSALFELTHTKNEKEEYVPNFCFASDISVDDDRTEEEIAVIALKNDYKVYKVFPGETMLGGLLIVAEGATTEPVENMYKEFYGEVPEIAEMKLDDDDNLVEVEVELEESAEGKSIKQEIEDILNKYKDEDRSKITLFEVDPGTFIEPFDDEDVDFSQFSHKKQNDGESDMYSFTITGGLNGAGDWEVYLDDIKKIFKDFKKELKLEPVLYKVDTDLADDVWNAYIFLYENPTDSQLKESLIKEDLQVVDEPKAKKIRVPIKLQELGWSANSCDCYELDDELSNEALDYIYDSYRDTYKIDDYVSSGNSLYLIVHYPHLGTTYSSIAFSGGTLISDVPQEFIDKVVSSAEEEIEEDFDLHPLEITDEDRFGDIEAFKNEYKRRAEELGASIEFHTKVGPKRLDSSWYKDEGIATIKYKDYIIDIFGLSEDVFIVWNGEDIDFEDFESYGIYNDGTIPDCEDMGYSGIEFSIVKQDGNNREPYSGYGDLDFDTMWDLKSALDIKSYIEDVIPVYEEAIGVINESKNKRPKLTVRDPNAAAMWGRTRHRVELPKKGKGSFKRHPKHRVDEAFYTPEPEDVERFTNLLKENGWTIESVKEDDSRYDEANNIHIQLIDTKTFPVEVPENATDQTKYEAHRKYCVDEGHADEVWSRADEVENIINQFDPDRKYHITYSASFGGTSHTGVDCTGKVTVGMDMRPYFVDDDFAHTEMIGEGKKKRKTKNPLKAAAERHQKSNNKKHAMGWFIVPNVEKSIQAFNHANNAPGAESTITAPAGLGEDLDLSTADNYAWDFDSANKYLTMNYRFDDSTGRYTNDTYYFARIPETALKVSRDDYKTHKLLKRRKNKHVLDGVEKFFNEHPKSKYCIISCRDISRSEPGRFVNAYRVLDEDLDLVPATYTKDGFTKEHSYDNGSSFYMDGIQAEAFIDELVPYLTQDLKRRKEQGYITPFDEYDISVAKSYNKTREDDRGFITLEKDDMYVYVTLTPDIWLDASCDFAIPIEDFKEVFKNIVDIDRIPISVPGIELTPEEVEEIKAALNVAEPVNESVCKVLEKVEKHDTLNQLLWDENNKLKPEVRETILQIVKDFTDGLEQDGIKFKIKDIVLVGSNCSYNYTDKSDLDIHIRMDTDSLECPDNLYPLLYGAYRALYNNKMDIDFYGIPVEIYVETDDTQQLNEPVDNQE